ncbi:MAG TPA: hypothetical protein VFO85_05675, partial [Vicinamibacteria bacterium]|nr:hypothetical protein [Vicinamibacteria bacterium]
MRRAFPFLVLLSTLAALPPAVQAAPERTVRARILEIDGRRDLVRADVRGRATAYRAADAGVLRGFRKGDLVF